MPRLVLALLLLATLGLASAEPLRVVYPASDSPADPRFNDIHEFLRIALDKTVASHGPYTLAASRTPMNEARYLSELRLGKTINVAWSSTSEEKEQVLLPIRICLRKGLLGYRISLIRAYRQTELDRVHTLADLRKLKVGQGIGWGDIRVYETEGIKVTVSEYDNLFRMVSLGRFDLFPRGIGEVFNEYANRRKGLPELAIEQHMALYYPWPYYLFFHPKDGALAERVRTGLKRMQADGSFDAIFWKYNRSAIEKARLNQRRLIRLSNPLLPPATPLNDASLWFDPLRDKPPPAGGGE